MTTIAAHRHAIRRDTAANWTATNPVLAAGEEALERQTDGSWLRKVGDGSTAWSALGYADRGPAGTDGTDGTDGAPGSSDLTFTDNGDGTGTISWNSGANSVTFPLLSSGVVTAAVIPAVALTTVQTADSQAAMLALTAQQGDVCVRTDTNIAYMLSTGGDPATLADWIQISQPGAVVSVAGRTGAVTLTSADLSDVTTVGKNVMTASNQATARSAIGAGTSDLTLGTTSTTAAAGNDARLAPAPSVADAGKIPTVKSDGTGYVLAAGGGALTTLAGHNTANITVATGTTATLFTTASLAPGKWLVTCQVMVTVGSTSGSLFEITATVASGTATLDGVYSAESDNSGFTVSIPMTFLVTVTAAATLTITGKASGSGPQAVVRYVSGSSGYPNMTGYTAVKVA